MARRERKDEDAKPSSAGSGGEDYTFVLPDFDERTFMQREITGARVTFIAAGVGAVAGVVARVVHVATEAAGLPWQIAMLVLLAAILAVPRIAPRFGAEVDAKDWKAVLGNGFTVFFTGLAAWILLLNVL